MGMERCAHWTSLRSPALVNTLHNSQVLNPCCVLGVFFSFSCIVSSLWIKPEWKAADTHCANKITLRGGCSSWNLPSPCCYGYLQQVAQWEWLCHQQRIREAQLGEALTPECNGTAESDKGGGMEEKWWEAFPAKQHPQAQCTRARTDVHRLAHQCASNHRPLFSLLCLGKVLPTSWGSSALRPCLNYSVSLCLPSVLMELCRAWEKPYTDWADVCLEIFLIWGWIALVCSTRSTRVAGFWKAACLGRVPSFSCPDSLDKFQGFSLCQWVQILQIHLSQENQDSNKSLIIKISLRLSLCSRET